MFKARLATPAARSHLENLYFTLLFVLRAVTKVRLRGARCSRPSAVAHVRLCGQLLALWAVTRARPQRVLLRVWAIAHVQLCCQASYLVGSHPSQAKERCCFSL